MKPLRSVVAIIASGFVLPLVISTYGCKKDEPPPPLPSAAPAATPTPTAALELAPEPAPVDSAPDAGKKPGGGVAGPGLMNCCKALLQNAASAPPPNNLYMTQAGQLCTAMVQGGQGSGPILSAIAGKMGGANMPTACR